MNGTAWVMLAKTNETDPDPQFVYCGEDKEWVQIADIHADGQETKKGEPHRISEALIYYDSENTIQEMRNHQAELQQQNEDIYVYKQRVTISINFV